MKSKKQTVGMKRSPRYVAVSAVVTAIAIVIGCVSTALHGSSAAVFNNSLRTDGGSILKAVGQEEMITTNDWNITTVDLEIVTSFDVTVAVDGVTRTVVMESGTVADALDMAGVTVGEDDIVSLPLDTAITAATAVSVDRVTFKERTETETVAYGKTSYETKDYNKGESVVVTSGKNGEKTLVYKDRYVNGELADSTLEEEFISVEPVDEVTAIGTYVKPAANTNVGSAGSTADFTYSAVYYGKGTAYTNEGGICGEYTASGMKAQVGVVAVNPKVIPYGTKLYITTADGSYTYGYCVAGDTGGFIYSHPDTIVDLFFNTVAECYQFGRRDVIVYVLD